MPSIIHVAGAKDIYCFHDGTSGPKRVGGGIHFLEFYHGVPSSAAASTNVEKGFFSWAEPAGAICPWKLARLGMMLTQAWSALGRPATPDPASLSIRGRRATY